MVALREVVKKIGRPKANKPDEVLSGNRGNFPPRPESPEQVIKQIVQLFPEAKFDTTPSGSVDPSSVSCKTHPGSRVRREMHIDGKGMDLFCLPKEEQKGEVHVLLVLPRGGRPPSMTDVLDAEQGLSYLESVSDVP